MQFLDKRSCLVLNLSIWLL